METPFNFTAEDKPEPSSSGGGKKLIAGRYNLVFDRVANESDYADDKGICEGKNGWKALKLFFKLKQSEGKEKEITFSETFCCDYDPLVKDASGNSKRESLVEMGMKKYKALCFVAGANLENTDSLVGREFSCELKEGENGYMELDPGAVGQNWGESVDQDANENSEASSETEETKNSVLDIDDENIPF